MRTPPREIDAMRRAIALSAHGIATASPNPPVGCVILDHAGNLAGEGYHARKGGPHAEVNALTAAGDRASGGTAVVTLEPCNHHGRTPPCHQALLDAGVTRVVIAVIDPTSRGEGGAHKLRAAGIDVQVDVLEDEARLVLGPWLDALASQRPQVTWLYRLGPEGIRPLPDDLCDVADLQYGFDAVVNDDGGIEEGVPGTHGETVFSIPTLGEAAAPNAILSNLYDSGIRRLLLHGGTALAQPFLDRSCVDAVEAWFTHVPASGVTGVKADSDRFLPPGFRLDRIKTGDTAIVINAVRR